MIKAGGERSRAVEGIQVTKRAIWKEGRRDLGERRGSGIQKGKYGGRGREDLRDKKVDLEVGGGENSGDGRETRDEKEIMEGDEGGLG